MPMVVSILFALPVTLTLAIAAAMLLPAPEAQAKGPGRTYCFYKTCHRVKTIAETQALIGRDMTLKASFYDSCKKDRFNPCGLTSSGERFHPERADNAASPILPDGTIALVWSKATREAVVLRINNAGPYWGDRKLDLSKAAARKLGIKGVGEVVLRVLKAPTAAEARYSKHRVYDPVPGSIGTFASLDAAHGAMSVMVAMGLPSTKGLAGAPVSAVALAEAAPSFDLASDLSAVYKSPLVPRFDVLEGGFKTALSAQADAEQERRRTAGVTSVPSVALTREASIDARPVAAVATPVAVPNAVAPVAVSRQPLRAAPVTGRTIRTADVAAPSAPVPEAMAPVTAGRSSRAEAGPKASRPRPTDLHAAKSSVRPAVSSPVKRARLTQKKAVSRPASKDVQSSPVTKVARTAVGPALRPVSRRAAHEAQTGEIQVGFTTYAEARYRTKARATVSGAKPVKRSKIAKRPGAKAAPATAVASGAQGATTVKRAMLPKAGGRSAALKKGGGWQSSAVMADPLEGPVRFPSPRLMGPVLRLPAGELRDPSGEEPPRGPRMRVHPSALT